MEDVRGGGAPDAAAVLDAVGVLVEAADLQALYGRVIVVACELLDADCASIQARVPDKQQLRLVAARGLVPEAAAFWECVDAGSSSTCGQALRRRQRVIIPDVESDESLAGTEDLRHMRLCGIRAVQSTPLLSSDGEPLGMLSTHWRRKHHPSSASLRLLDSLARQIVRLIEHITAQEARRAGERHLRIRVAALEHADHEKDSFLAMLAHELRNPLAPIRNVGEILAQVLQGLPAARRPLAILKRQTDQLTRLVDDLLDIARIQQGRLTLEEQPVDLAEVLAQAAETVQPLVHEKRQSLSIERPQAPAIVLGDRARLVQCVANLLQNAAKYTPTGGRIHVACVESAAKVTVTVSDDGAGIAAEVLPRIFEPFVQGEGTLEHSRGGLGIGLAIVKRLVEMHGGSVEARSEGEGRGSAFTIHLWRLESALAGASAGAAAAARSRRILVVDALPDAADTIAAILSATGHRVEVAYSALSALAVAEKLIPDAIVLELDLPRMSGYEVARRLRSHPELRSTLLIAVSGQRSDEPAARAAGFDRHLRKPIDVAALERALA